MNVDILYCCYSNFFVASKLETEGGLYIIWFEFHGMHSQVGRLEGQGFTP